MADIITKKTKTVIYYYYHY